jgi:hypothetical protein
MPAHSTTLCIELWHIDRFVFYALNPRKNDSAVDRKATEISRARL